MASSALKDIKLGFWLAAGFAFFALIAAIIVGMSGHAFVKGQ